MPIYEYECQSCEDIIEKCQSLSDDPLTTCPSCSGPLKKIISMSSFQLKGGGWYADGYSSSSSFDKSSSDNKTASSATSSSSSTSSSDAKPACANKKACCGC